MSYIKKILLSSLMIGLSVPLGYTSNPAQTKDKAAEGWVDDSAIITGSLRFIDGGSMELKNPDVDSYTVDGNGNITICSNIGNQSTLSAEKPITFDARSSLVIANNAQVHLGDTTLDNCCVSMAHDLYTDGEDKYERAIIDGTTVTFPDGCNQPVFPALQVAGTLKLVGNVGLEYYTTKLEAGAFAIEMGNDESDPNSVDITELTKIEVLTGGYNRMVIKTNDNTVINYISEDEKAQMGDPSMQSTILNRLKKLMKNPPEDGSLGLMFTGQPIVYNYKINQMGSAEIVEFNGAHNVIYKPGSAGAPFLTEAMVSERGDLAGLGSKFNLFDADEPIGSGGVAGFLEAIETAVDCSNCGNPTVPNSLRNNFTAWPDGELPLYPVSDVNISSYDNFDNGNKIFAFNMNIVDYDRDSNGQNEELCFDCGTYGVDKETNKPLETNTSNYIKKLTINGNNSGFSQTVSLSGNQLEEIVFGNPQSWVDLDLSNIVDVTNFKLSVADKCSDKENKMVIKSMPVLEAGVKIEFDTGANNFIQFILNEDSSKSGEYKFDKFTFNQGSTVELQGNVSLTI